MRDLAQYSSDAALIEDVFKSDEVRAHMTGGGSLHLILDSVDECRVHIASLSKLLAKQIARLPPDRTLVSIGCRTAVWLSRFRTLEQEAARHFSDIAVLELVPLCETDAKLAADHRGHDGQAFVREVVAKDVGPLACRPITLMLLLDLFSGGGSLPESKLQLFSDGLAKLASEPNDSRVDSGTSGALQADRRLLVASRIAAAMTLSGRHRIRMRGNAGTEEISLSELLGTERMAGGDLFAVTEDALREVVDTGLFTGTGEDHVAFAHATYQDFLAALFTASRGLTQSETATVLQLDDTGRPPAQLTGLTAWLAAMVPALRDRLILADPATVLEGDISIMPPDQRLALSESILAGFATRRLLNRWWDARRHYARLAGPGLDPMLRRTLTEKDGAHLARVVAIDIACATAKGGALDDALLRVALDADEDPGLRTVAASALATMGSAASRQLLKPLLALPPDQDPQDDLRGYALDCLWPDHLSSAELFAALTKPRRKNFYGGYARFLERLSGVELTEQTMVDGPLCQRELSPPPGA